MNKKIIVALFMGGILEREDVVRIRLKVIRGQVGVEHLEFDSDWRWLMEVVKKIDEILYVSSVDYIDGNNEHLESFYALGLKNLKYGENITTVSTDIEAVFEDVVKFIEWYNKNKS